MGKARYYHHNESFLISPLFRIKKDGRLHSYTPPSLHLHIKILGILKNTEKNRYSQNRNTRKPSHINAYSVFLTIIYHGFWPKSSLKKRKKSLIFFEQNFELMEVLINDN